MMQRLGASLPAPVRTSVLPEHDAAAGGAKLLSRSPMLMALGAAGLIGLAGCGVAPEPPPSADSGYPLAVSNCGRDVTFDGPPTRIVAHREMSTLIASAGGTGRIVARAGEAGVPLGPYADSLGQVPQIMETDMSAPSREVVLGEQADLVVAGRVQADYISTLDQVGVNVLVPPWFCSQVTSDDPEGPAVGFDDLYSTIETYGRVFDSSEAAARTVSELRRRVTEVEQTAVDSAPRTVVNVWLGRETVTSVYGALSINDTIMGTLGLTNLFGDLQARNPQVNFEEVLGKDPEMIIVSYLPSNGYADDAAAIRAFGEISGVQGMKAVRDGRVVAINSAYLAGGPLSVDGLEMLADKLSGLS